ncbi:MAG: hypothetical protein JWO59_2531, partial [Chloroflexi bacterium]|nr:hypothetical protein [Chloroflexota bacterium]
VLKICHAFGGKLKYQGVGLSKGPWSRKVWCAMTTPREATTAIGNEIDTLLAGFDDRCRHGTAYGPKAGVRSVAVHPPWRA